MSKEADAGLASQAGWGETDGIGIEAKDIGVGISRTRLSVCGVNAPRLIKTNRLD